MAQGRAMPGVAVACVKSREKAGREERAGGQGVRGVEEVVAALLALLLLLPPVPLVLAFQMAQGEEPRPKEVPVMTTVSPEAEPLMGAREKKTGAA